LGEVVRDHTKLRTAVFHWSSVFSISCFYCWGWKVYV